MADKSASSQVGKVMVASGGVFLETAKGLTPLTPDSPVYRNSVIVTKETGHVEVKFEDGTVLSQGVNSRMAVDNYVFDSHGASPSSLLFNMSQGAFRVITGKIATQNPENFNVKTPLATIGIRGTDFSIETGPNGDLVLVGTISPDHILLVEDHFGTVRFINYAGMVVVLDEQNGIIEVRQATPEEIERIQAGTPVTSHDYQQEEGQVGNGHDDAWAGHDGADRGGDSHGNDHSGNHGRFDTGLFSPFGDYHGFDVYRGQDGYHGLLDDQGSPAADGPTGGAQFLPNQFADALVLVGSEVYDPPVDVGGGIVPVVSSEIFGTPDPDILTGTTGPDNIYGLADNDLISGGPGNDKLYGMDGDDALFGGSGTDIIVGGAGNDSISGGVGNDILFGGPGQDFFAFMEKGSDNADAIMDFVKSLTSGDRIVLNSSAFPGLQFNTYGSNFLLSQVSQLVTTTFTYITDSMTSTSTVYTNVFYSQFVVVNGGAQPDVSGLHPYLAYFNTNGRLCYDPDGGQLNPDGTIAVLNTVNGGHPTGSNLNFSIIGFGAGLSGVV